jgi:hypothetical protein
MCSHWNGSNGQRQFLPQKIIYTALHQKVHIRHLNQTILLLESWDPCFWNNAQQYLQHKYITKPIVPPVDAIIVATANLSHVIQTHIVAKELNDVKLANLTHLQNIIKMSPAFSQQMKSIPNTITSPCTCKVNSKGTPVYTFILTVITD